MTELIALFLFARTKLVMTNLPCAAVLARWERAHRSGRISSDVRFRPARPAVAACVRSACPANAGSRRAPRRAESLRGRAGCRGGSWLVEPAFEYNCNLINIFVSLFVTCIYIYILVHFRQLMRIEALFACLSLFAAVFIVLRLSQRLARPSPTRCRGSLHPEYRWA